MLKPAILVLQNLDFKNRLFNYDSFFIICQMFGTLKVGNTSYITNSFAVFNNRIYFGTHSKFLLRIVVNKYKLI